MSSEELDKLKTESKTKETVVEVVKDETADLGLRTTAMVRAKFDAYLIVSKAFEAFIIHQAKELGSEARLQPNTMADRDERSLARLISDWLLTTGAFLDENESRLQGLGYDVRKKYVEESLQEFPPDIRDELLEKFRKKKHEILIWFTGEIQRASAKAKEREKS